MKVDRTLALGLIIALCIASFPSYVIGGSPGFGGYLLGLGSGLVSFTALFSLVWAMGASPKDSNQQKVWITFIVLALFLKFPLIGFASQAARRLGEPGPGCFGTSLVLVYSAAIILVYLSGKSAY